MSLIAAPSNPSWILPPKTETLLTLSRIVRKKDEMKNLVRLKAMPVPNSIQTESRMPPRKLSSQIAVSKLASHSHPNFVGIPK